MFVGTVVCSVNFYVSLRCCTFLVKRRKNENTKNKKKTNNNNDNQS